MQEILSVWPLFVAAFFCALWLPRLGAAIADTVNRHLVEDARETLGLEQEAPAGADPGESAVDADVPEDPWSLWLRVVQRDLWFLATFLAALLSMRSMPAHAGAVWQAGTIGLMVVLTTVSGSDIARRMIPDAVMIPAIVAAVMYNAWFHSEPWMTYQVSLASCVSIYVLMEVFSFVGSLFGEPAGGGDSKLMAFIAAWIGFLPALLTIGLALVIALGHVKTRRLLRYGLRGPVPESDRNGFPLAPYLAFSFFVMRFLLVAASARFVLFRGA